MLNDHFIWVLILMDKKQFAQCGHKVSKVLFDDVETFAFFGNVLVPEFANFAID